jgi:hypothetical protein
MFTDLYLNSTNPKINLNQFMNLNIKNIIFSTIFHTIIYAGFCNLVSFIFFGKFLLNIINIRLIISLLIIMFSGFFARYLHVKEIYKAYNYNLDKTRNHLDRLYIGWIFIS